MATIVTSRNDDSRSEADRAHALLRASLLSGEFKPGEKLRPAMLQEKLDVGLTPLRESLMRLSVEGLVVGEAQRGFHVRQVTLDEFVDLMETRRELERICIVRAIERGTAEWEAQIVAAEHLLALTPLPKTPRDVAAAELWEVRHRAFHHALVSACGSPWRLQFWNRLTDHSERYRKLRLLRRHEPVAQVRDFVTEHRRLMNAVVARDVARACQLVDQHLLVTQKSVSRLLMATAED
jgi:DNA-binding GntR family transcriptional regulator